MIEKIERNAEVELIAIPPAPVTEPEPQLNAAAPQLTPTTETRKFDSATQALYTLLHLTVVGAVTKTYQPSKNIFQATIDGIFFDDQGHFSIRNTLLALGALSIGATASFFAIPPGEKAVSYLAQLILNNPQAKFAHEKIVQRIAQTMSASRTMFLGSFSAMHLLNAFFSPKCPPAHYLMYEKPKAANPRPPSFFKQSRKFIKEKGRVIWDVSNAAAAQIPVVAIEIPSAGIAAGILVPAATMSFSYLGMMNFNYKSLHPGLAAELNYLKAELDGFLKLPADVQLRIMDKFKSISELPFPESERDELLLKRLFTLSKETDSVAKEHSELNPEHVTLQAHQGTSTLETCLSYGLGGAGAFAAFAFTEQSGVEVARLFKDSTSGKAITLGLIAAFLSFLPNIGFGYIGGKRAGAKMASSNTTLPKEIYPQLRRIIDLIALFLNCFAGSTSVYFNYNFSMDFANLFKFNDIAKRYFALTEIGVTYAASTIYCAYYVIAAIDELIVFYAKHVGNEDVKKLVNFVMGVHQLLLTLEKSDKRNYFELVSHDFVRRNDLAHIRHAIYSKELSDGEYAKFQEDLLYFNNKYSPIQRDRMNSILPDRLTPDDYTLREIVPESELRHRKNARSP